MREMYQKVRAIKNYHLGIGERTYKKGKATNERTNLNQ